MLSEGAESCGLVRMMMRLVMSEESSRMTGDVEMGMEGDPSTMTASADIDWEGEALVELGQALKFCYIIAHWLQVILLYIIVLSLLVLRTCPSSSTLGASFMTLTCTIVNADSLENMPSFTVTATSAW